MKTNVLRIDRETKNTITQKMDTKSIRKTSNDRLEDRGN